MRLSIVSATSIAFATALGVVIPWHGVAVAEVSEQAPRSRDLRVSTKSSDSITGSYEQDNRPQVTFTSHVIAKTHPLKTNTQGIGHRLYTRAVSATITVGEKRITFTVRPRTRTLTRDSQPGTALSDQDIQALRATLRGLVQRTDLDEGRVTNERAVLVKALSYLAQAPSGYALRDLTVRFQPVTRSMRTGHIAATVPGSCGDKIFTTRIDAALPLNNPDGGPNDEDGVNLLNCGAATLTAWHDSTNHGFRRSVISAGPDSGIYMGRCGTGAFQSGWTVDCLDHDYCSQQHNSSWGTFDGNCGDEFDWAIDDYFQTETCQCARGDGHDCGPGVGVRKKKTAATARG